MTVGKPATDASRNADLRFRRVEAQLDGFSTVDENADGRFADETIGGASSIAARDRAKTSPHSPRSGAGSEARFTTS
jgi:hypothetical protein